MNRLCCVCYGADDKNSVSFEDFDALRVIECKCKKETPSFFAKQKIRRLSHGFDCMDSLEITENTININPKALFIRDIHKCIAEYARFYGLDFSDSELAVSGSISRESMEGLCSVFKMVWTTEEISCDIYNLYSVKHRLPMTDVAVFADNTKQIPESKLIFNLTDFSSIGIENIEISADLPACITDIHAQEIVNVLGFDYKITNFVK